MSHAQAIHILDRVREGWDYPLQIINQALMMTGDIE